MFNGARQHRSKGAAPLGGRAMLTSSAWGKPPTRLYRLLGRVQARGGTKVAIIGCSDGRFVLPFARRGLEVTAIDVDPVALWGGTKNFPDGPRHVLGLANRLRRENLEGYVDIRQMDLAHLGDDPTHDLVFTSGSLHYSRNHKVPLQHLLGRLIAQASSGGLIYIDYMLPLEPRHFSAEHYIKRGQLRQMLQELGCKTIYEHYSGIILERAHVDNPADHYHSLGYLLARAPGSDA